MNTFAQILYNTAHWIFQSNEMIEQVQARFSPDCVFIDITNINPQPQEGWSFDGRNFFPPVLYATLADAKAAKLEELSNAAAKAYVAGFQSSASGKALWYDSDKDTQTVINRQYLIALSNPAAYNSTVFFFGVPAGLTPVRAKVTASDPDSTKTVQLLNAAQMVQLGNDLATAWASVKAMLWNLQGQVNAASSIEQITAISWTTGS